MSSEARKIRLVMELRRAGIDNTAVLSALERIDRADFVPETFQTQAYDDTALPIACGQTISQPFIVAYMSQALQVGNRMKVLEIGTGSGYQAAVLAQLCRRLYTIERHRPLLQEAEHRFAHIGITNITAICGDGTKGWPIQAPFDRILVTAAAPNMPELLREQLADGGVMVVPVGDHSANQHILRITRQGDDFTAERLLPVRFVPLVPGIAEAEDE